MVLTFTSLFSIGTLAQSIVRGKVVDENNEPIIGASITVSGTTQGGLSDNNGNFKIQTATKATLEISSLGYKKALHTITKTTNLGLVQLEQDPITLNDIVVRQSVASARKTPIALSTLSSEYIAEKLGAQDLPEILKSTPGVFATKQGGGFGDTKVNIRGFKSENVAVMINGVPVNDMEWGGIYWSNWNGLTDVTRSIQSQRGLGASKVSAPSVGGSIHIITNGIETEKGGSASFGIGNDGLFELSMSLATGLTKNGWSATVYGARKWGDGYIQGTNFIGYNYYVNVSKRINTHHQLSLTAFGTPQKHAQRNYNDALTLENWQRAKNYMKGESAYKYNPSFGRGKNGEVKTSAYNVFHKPQISLNHQWQINHKSALSTAVYVSIAQGYGYGGQGRDGYSNSSWYGSSNGNLNETFRHPDGSFGYDMIQEMNTLSTNGSKMIMSKSINNHQWYGLLSTYTNQIGKYFDLTAGVDVRYYIGNHTNEIVDLYDGSYYMDDNSRKNVKATNNAAAADPNFKYQKLQTGDVVYRDYDGHTHQEGAFAQIEYNRKKINAFLSGSLSNTGYWRYDRFYYDAAHAESEHLNFLGFTFKGGVNYNITPNHNIFANIGYISRAPFFSGGAFLQSTTSNAVNPDAVNEKIFSAELGYGYHSTYFTANLNAYYTKWMDKSMAKSEDFSYTQEGQTLTDRWTINMNGLNARHMGIELDLVATPTRWMDLTGMFSYGDWQWDSNASGYFYNSLGQPMKDLQGNIASAPQSEDHMKSTINLKGVKVGGSAQTTAAIGIRFKPLKGLRIGLDWTVYARNYADYTISAGNINTSGKPTEVTAPWRVPWGNQFDLSASYGFRIGQCRATVIGNVNNLFDQEYIMDAYNGNSGDWNTARVFYAFGRTFTVRIKVNF
ncbi:MAG: TonB-dependent receptor [Alistipes sp.]